MFRKRQNRSYYDMKTFLKWAGNKSSLVEIISPYLKGTNLIEPFAGSCAVSLNTNFEKYTCNDINGDLIKMYEMIQSDVDNFLNKAKDYFQSGNNQDRYMELRELYNNTGDSEEKAVLFLYLNRHCFNGLCRYNKSGKFNVPFGSYTDPLFPEKEIRDFAEYTKDKFSFTNKNFEDLFLQADKNTTIYCDPPYSALTKTSDFSNYTGLDFNNKAHEILRDLAISASENNKCQVVISNHDTEETRKLYESADILVSFRVRRTISSKTTERNLAPELLAIYKPKK